MQVFEKITDWLANHKQIPTSLGFVPTLGNLHAGHVSLIQRSLTENDKTIVSIFINPTQFNQKSDFVLYPRTLTADLELLKQLNVDYCLLPSEAEIYPDKFNYRIQEHDLSLILEGTVRPGHFTGMLTIVMKLFHIVQPTHAYFGEKDYQQLQLIKKMVEAFFMPVTIIACPTIREASGLPLSSRNSRLSYEEKKQAEQVIHIFQTENDLEKAFYQIKALGVAVDYLSEIDKYRLIAYTISSIRLIDNKFL
jgi:pantoate--beta-alanine ligase